MNESEWLTRKKRIDGKLRSLNPAWEIVKHREGLDLSKLTRHAVEELPTANGPADYALFVKGKLFGIIEAKKVTVNPQNVLEQAKRYSKGVFEGVGNWDGYKVPFLYATNGEIIWHLDLRNEKKISRRISNLLAQFNEQGRIVEKLEKLLGKVDACQKRLERIPLILKRFRQSVLADISAIDFERVKMKD